MAIIVDVDETFEEIWESLVNANILADDQLAYLDGIHQKALALDALTKVAECTCCCHNDPYCPICTKG
jgi:hypothetical protein